MQSTMEHAYLEKTDSKLYSHLNDSEHFSIIIFKEGGKLIIDLVLVGRW